MSEFRKDIVSGDWIVMAPERAGRPHGLKDKAARRKPSPVRDCPFEHPDRTGNWPPVRQWPEKGKWRIILINNKYPALRYDPGLAREVSLGVYRRVDGIGWHDLVVTRDHRKDFPKLPPQEAVRVLEMFQERYRDARAEKCLRYVSAFGNWGVAAGASLFHPHYQLLSLPIIPPHVTHALRGSERYRRAHGRCAHCDMIAYERKRRQGVVWEDAAAIAIAPYASREPYTVHIFPKVHAPYFEHAPEATVRSVAAALQKVLGRITQRLNDPDYNFFIHSAPFGPRARYDHYHWHIEVVPKTNIAAGFELSTGIEINTVTPEAAAKLLR